MTSRGDATRQRILDASERALAAHGFEALRAPEVAEDAGVSEATVWHHFGSKTGLLAAVMQRYYEALAADIARVVESGSSPADRLRAFSRFWLHRMTADLPVVGELQRHGRHGHAPELVATFADCNRLVTRPFERLVEDLVAGGHVRDGLRPRAIRDAFFGTAEHVLVGAAVTGRPADLDRAADDLLDLLLLGAAPRDTTGPAPTLASIERKLDRLLASARGG